MLTNVFNINALALDADTIEKMWQVPILGMAMIFAVLGILWAVLALFKVVFAGKTPKAEKPKKEKAKKTETAPKKASATAQPTGDDLMAVLTAAITAHQNNDEIIAVLTAAVSAYRAEAGESGAFRVVAFKRARARAWNRK